MSQEECPFCARCDRGEFDRRWPLAIAFAPLHPVTPGHMLVVSTEHVENAASDPMFTGKVMEAAAELAAEVGECNIITSVGSAATQTVFHLHVHVVPRRPGDGLLLPWGGPHA